MITKHTPTPWTLAGRISPADSRIVIQTDDNTGAYNRQVAVVDEHQDAAFIVRACNAHDGLLEALENCPDVSDGRVTAEQHCRAVWNWYCEYVQPARAKAKGGAA